jgi:hypothetical protein
VCACARLTILIATKQLRCRRIGKRTLIPYSTLLASRPGHQWELVRATADGGANACSGLTCRTVFSLSVGLPPFVETRPTTAKVGATINILGTDLTGATGVNFNGNAATFTVVPSSEITTTVPAGATTGEVQVLTASGTLLSNVSFRVLP